MKQTLYTLAIGHLDGPAAEIFPTERAALERRLQLAEVSDAQREHILQTFDSGDANMYDAALNQLESEVTVVCLIERHVADGSMSD